MSLNVYLTKYEFKLFICLLNSPGVNQTNEVLINTIWNESGKDNSNLIQLISKTRRHLKPLEHVFKIKSQRGKGYTIVVNNNYNFIDDCFRANEVKQDDDKETFTLDITDKIFSKELVLSLLISLVVSLYILNRTLFFPDINSINDRFIRMNCYKDKVIKSTYMFDCDKSGIDFSKNKNYVLSTFDEKIVYTEK
ncbi:helix-turn-helix domain-containing protein [Aliivibrio fischeri]|nr:helix-turn-helix domain-containing protein [Aliivibrio fischeri]MBP3139408.1 helix-turn-helix domain-containing protein [Aliivibrio fischeri]MBP3154999.1 helix-turn-helix domain-containing protein [Aliivibrio fischeri]